MTRNSSEIWSLCIGRWRGVEVRLHILLPVIALVGLLLALQTKIATPPVIAWALVVLVVSVACHEIARVIAAARVGGHADAIVLGPVGGWTKLHLPVDPPAHIATALAGPMTFFVLMVVAGCGLALAGDQHVLRLLNLCNPQIGPLATEYDPLGTADSIVPIIGQLVVWINCWLFLVSLMPIDPCAGAQLMRSVLWPIVGRTTATSLTSLVALGASVLAVLLALVLPPEITGSLVPSWFPLALTGLFLLYGGSRTSHERRYDVGLTIDEFDSDDEDWLTGEWVEEDREAVLVEHLQDKQQEVIDRKRREREASEDARVDAILARLRHIRFEQLSDEDRSILKRASRRYRRRRTGEHES